MMQSKATSTALPRFKFVPELDGMRAIAVSLVFLSHAGLGNILPGGFGVNIFFFLSGYLITSLMRDEFQHSGTVSLRNFYIRRCLRILPPMWIAMALAALLALSGAILNDMTVSAIVAQVLFLINYADLWGTIKGVPGIPLWSLAVEEHFYLLFPIIFVTFLAGRNARRVALLLAAACVAFLLLRMIEYSVTSSRELIYYRSHLRMDSILFGCILAVWQNPVLDGVRAWRPNWLHFGLATGLLLFTLVYRNDAFRETLRYTLQGIGLFGTYSFILSRTTFVNSILKLAPLQIVGRYSYSIYLVHIPILFLFEQNMPGSSAILKGLFAAALTLAISALINVAVEKPAARLRHAFSPASKMVTNEGELRAAL